MPLTVPAIQTSAAVSKPQAHSNYTRMGGAVKTEAQNNNNRNNNPKTHQQQSYSQAAASGTPSKLSNKAAAFQAALKERIANHLENPKCDLLDLSRLITSNEEQRAAMSAAAALEDTHRPVLSITLGPNTFFDPKEFFLKQLPQLQNCRRVNLTSVKLKDDDVMPMVVSLRGQQRLEHLKLGDNNITDAGIAHLASALKGTPLTLLHIGNNPITSAGLSALGRGLAGTVIEVLGLRDLKMDAAGAVALAEGLSEARLQLKELQLRGNKDMTPTGLRRIFESLPSSLVSVDLSGCGITDDIVGLLCSKLLHCHALEELHLKRNAIGDLGGHALGELIGSAQALANVYLSYNEIGPRGSNLLLRGLTKSRALQSLDVSHNPLREGAAGLAEVLSSMCPLLAVQFNACQIPTAALAAIFDVLRDSDHPLKNMSINDNFGGDALVPALCDALRANNTLTQLHICCNEIGEAGMQLVSEAANDNETLRCFTFGGQTELPDRPVKNEAEKVRRTIDAILRRNREAASRRHKQLVQQQQQAAQAEQNNNTPPIADPAVAVGASSKTEEPTTPMATRSAEWRVVGSPLSAEKRSSPPPFQVRVGMPPAARPLSPTPADPSAVPPLFMPPSVLEVKDANVNPHPKWCPSLTTSGVQLFF